MRIADATIGTIVGRLTVIGQIERREYLGKMRAWVRVRCTCMKELAIPVMTIGPHHAMSCGCLKREVSAGRLREMPNEQRGRRPRRVGKRVQWAIGSTPEYQAWASARKRCFNPRDPSYPRYGGRGITMCERWNSFEVFLEDMGARPGPGYSIDRINNDGNYEPSNCRWATGREQGGNKSSNRVIEWRGERRTVSDWARHVGLHVYTLTQRLDADWDVERALTTPSRSKKAG
jgi:hypothetical protein